MIHTSACCMNFKLVFLVLYTASNDMLRFRGQAISVPGFYVQATSLTVFAKRLTYR
jgi:hypothetical protein